MVPGVGWKKMKYADVRDSQLAQGMNCEPARKEATVAGYATARPAAAAAGVVSEQSPVKRCHRKRMRRAGEVY